MWNKPEFRVLLTESDNLRFVWKDKFEFRTGRHEWLQKICFWILRKLHCNAHDLTFYRQWKVPQPGETVYEQLLAHLFNVLDETHYEPEELLIVAGRETFMDLVKDKNAAVALHFDLKGRGHRLWKTPVTVVPWMEGVLVIPQHQGY